MHRHRLIASTALLLIPLVLAGCVTDEPTTIDTPETATAAPPTATSAPCPLEGDLVDTRMESVMSPTELTFPGAEGCTLYIWTATHETVSGHTLRITDESSDVVHENNIGASVAYGGTSNPKEDRIAASKGTYTVTLDADVKATVSVRVAVV